jgi:pimeloyl-ACP methyl ester carboxylesterase
MALAGRFLGRVARLAATLVLLLLLVLLVLRLLAAAREDQAGRPRSTVMIATPLGAVAANITGPADGPPILLVHGTAAWSGFWSAVSSHLAAAGWRVIAVDLPTFGYSDHDPKARYDRTSQALRLAFVLRASAGAPAVVVGHSFGAGAATELALRDPGAVRRLVLVDAALGRLDPPANAHSAIERITGIGLFAQPLTSAVLTNPAMTGRLVRSMIVRKQAADDWLGVLRQPMRRKGTTAAYADWLPALFASDDGGLSRHSDRLRAIKPPVALIWGAADTVTPPAQGETIAALTHADSFIRLPGVGHIPHIEDQGAFLRALDASIPAAREKP